MKREEEIIDAGIEYTMQTSPCCIGEDNFYKQARGLNRNKSFEAGAQWADEHPKSPWISVKDDLPCNHPELTLVQVFTKTVIVKYKDTDNISLERMIKGDKGNWKFIGNVTHWMPIPELPKD